MIEKYGTPSNWQRAMTNQWITKLASEDIDKKLLILEGHVNLDFIVDAFKYLNFSQYAIILVYCENTIRHQRLHEARD